MPLWITTPQTRVAMTTSALLEASHRPVRLTECKNGPHG